MESDPRVWIFCDSEGPETEDHQRDITGCIGAYVDDFLISGREGLREWDKIISIFNESFRWTPWESGTFKQTGLTITQDPETYEFELEQGEYLKTISEIELSAQRKAQ